MVLSGIGTLDLGAMSPLLPSLSRIPRVIREWRANRADIRGYRRFPEVDEWGEGVREQLIADVWAQYGDEDLIAEWYAADAREKA